MAETTVEKKKCFLVSKTVIASALTALIPIIYPPAADYIAANPQIIMGGLGAIFAALRIVSHGKITIT